MIPRFVVEVLPHGIVTRLAAARSAARYRARVAARSSELRALTGAPCIGTDRRLNMGCGTHREPGWLNADSNPQAEIPLVLREGEPLPFVDSSVDVVFSEHFLEHLSFDEGRHFLRESQRILRPGGLFRVSCPDLDWIAGLLRSGSEDWRALAHVYESIGDVAEGEIDGPEGAINWAFYGHDHKHLWNLRQLERELSACGFGVVRRMGFGQSVLAGAAIERRRGEAFYSLIAEAEKPPA